MFWTYHSQSMSRSFLFNIGNIPSIPAGELIGIKGRAKQGKSQWEYILISVMLSGISKGDVMPLQDRYKVYYSIRSSHKQA